MPDLEKSDIQDKRIANRMLVEYGLNIAQIDVLPLGADRNTVVYQAITDESTPYFVKLRLGDFDETSVALPKFLSDLGITQVMAPLATESGKLWTNLETFRLILYPFIKGRNGYEAGLSDYHWVEFGAILKRIHSAKVPPELTSRIPRERYWPQRRKSVKSFLDRARGDVFEDPISVRLAGFLRSKHDEILDLVGRAERLAQLLQTRCMDFITCHSDIHAGNILIDASGALYIVDWDNPILAPKERDLMFVGGGLMGAQHSPREEEALFYQGYGPTQLDPVALAYYRYERIVQDVSEYCEQVVSTTESDADREQSFRYLASNFLLGGVFEIACRSDKTSKQQ